MQVLTKQARLHHKTGPVWYRNMLNTSHIRTFLAVVETGNYTAAARILHMSQPAVSQHIRSLEAQLGDVHLFRRIHGRMQVTHAGEVLLGMARELVDLAERAEERIKALQGKLTGRVCIGCAPGSGEHLLAPLLAAFYQRHPNVELELRITNYEKLLAALADHEVDLIFVEQPYQRKGWELTPMGHESLALIGPQGHAILQQPAPAVHALAKTPLLLPRPGTPIRRLIDDALQQAGLAITQLRIALETDSASLLIEGVRCGMGLAFVSAVHLLPQFLEDLAIIECAELTLHLDWHLLRNREHDETFAAHELYAYFASAEARSLLRLAGVSVANEVTR